MDTNKLLPVAIIIGIACGLLVIAQFANAQNDTAQYVQLKKYSAMYGTKGEKLASMLGMTLNTVDDYKKWLATTVAVNEGYTRDPNPARPAADNQTMANLDVQVSNYLCKIDQTYCPNGFNAPVRILVNAPR